MEEIIHHDFKIGFPDGWMDLSTVILGGPTEQRFRPSITITRERLNSPMNAEQYAIVQLPGLQQEFAPYNYEVLEEGPTVVGSMPCFQRFHVFNSPDGNGRVKQWQVYAVIGNDAITITCTHGEEHFEKARGTFEEAISRFSLVREGE